MIPADDPVRLLSAFVEGMDVCKVQGRFAKNAGIAGGILVYKCQIGALY